MSDIIALESKELPPDCYVYKHSTQCGISAQTAGVVRSVDVRLPIYWVNVIEQRELSNRVAQQYAIRHESPQLLLIRDGSLAKAWSHWDINPQSLA